MEGGNILGNPSNVAASYEFCFPQYLIDVCQHLVPDEHKWMQANCHHTDASFRVGLLKKDDKWVNFTLQGVQSDIFQGVLDHWQCHVDQLTPIDDVSLSDKTSHRISPIKLENTSIPPKKTQSLSCVRSTKKNISTSKVRKSVTDLSQSPRRSSKRSVKQNSLINDDIFDLGTPKRIMALETVHEKVFDSDGHIDKPCLDHDAVESAKNNNHGKDGTGTEHEQIANANFFTPHFVESSLSAVLSLKNEGIIEYGDINVARHDNNFNADDPLDGNSAHVANDSQIALRKCSMNSGAKSKIQLAKYKRVCHLCQYICYTEKTLRNHAIYKHHLSWSGFKEAIKVEKVPTEHKTVPPKERRPNRKASDLSVDAHSCTKCPKRFIVFSMLQRHIQRNHPGTAVPTKPGRRVSAVVVQCVICGVNNNGYRAISHVQREHANHPDFELVLETTKKRFQSQRCRLARSKQPPGKVACKYCGGWYERNGVRAHMLYRCRENPSRTPLFSCRSCGYGTPFREHLRAHMKMHPAENRHCYMCETCGKTYATRPGLVMHTRVAHSKKPQEENICEECGKSFEYAYRLQRHLKVHTRESKYTCELCARTFKASHTLKRHRETYHFDRYLFRCDLCGHGLDKLQYLEKHVCGRVRRGRSERPLAKEDVKMKGVESTERPDEVKVYKQLEVVVAKSEKSVESEVVDEKKVERNADDRLQIVTDTGKMEIGRELQISTEPQVLILQNGIRVQLNTDGPMEKLIIMETGQG